MGTEDALIAIEQKLTSDDKLLRMLHYVPSSFDDDPLSIAKPDIVGSNEQWDIVDEHIINVPYVDDLTDKQIGRIIFYIGDRYPNSGNQKFHDTRIIFDVLCHHKMEKVDKRLEKLMDYLFESFSEYKLSRVDKETAQIIGVGKITFLGGEPLGSVPGYVGHRLTFTIPIETGLVRRNGSRY